LLAKVQTHCRDLDADVAAAEAGRQVRELGVPCHEHYYLQADLGRQIHRVDCHQNVDVGLVLRMAVVILAGRGAEAAQTGLLRRLR
jgi:hypothetical protein